MKLNQWTIVKLNDINTYIIGLTKKGKLYKSSYIINYIDINNDYIKLKTEYDEVELRHNQRFKPTYIDKKLYRWDVMKYGDSVCSNPLEDLNRYHNEVKLIDNCYQVNNIKVNKEELKDIFEGRYLEGHRDREIGKRSLFETTEITHIKLYPKYIEVFTESGSNYLLYLSELY
jgi:hypothetical protein